ncbi:MAG: type II and III secretion system protein family protein [bacterium]|nr:type II and III secretion system protein family protein [bacterium]
MTLLKRNKRPLLRHALALAVLGSSLLAPSLAAAADCVAKNGSAVSCAADTQSLGELNLAVGQSLPLDFSALGGISRVFPGNRTVIDVFQDPKSGDIYLRGKKVGTSDLLVWASNHKKYRAQVTVGMDTGALGSQFASLMPDEKDIHVSTMADSLVLSGSVSDATRLKQVVALAEAYVRGTTQELVTDSRVFQAPENEPGKAVSARSGNDSTGARPVSLTQSGLGANRVINLLTVRGSQQVMLEVKIAEVSKSFLDRLGVDLKGSTSSGGWTYGILSGLLSGTGTANNTLLSAVKVLGSKEISVDAQKKDELVKILAEPNIVAISGQEGSFLSGGKVFIPTGRDRDGTITLEEKEYGVGLKFLPTVLGDSIIDLHVSPEVSELSKDGSAFTAGGITTVFPSITTRRASTTVQLRDGESFAIAGLLKNNVTEVIKRFPLLGDLPLVGALFRSSEFQSEKTELLFVITPHLVRAAAAPVPLPTDNFKAPSQTNFMLNGRLEGFHSGKDKEKSGDSQQNNAPAATTTPPGKGGAAAPAGKN